MNDPGLLIMTSLSSGPKHGHALLLDIEAFAGVRLGPGTLYGAITRLEERGLIEPLEAEDRRRPYRLTPAGTVALEDSLAGLRRVVDVALTRMAAAT
ncbi:MAG TPA: PadR family transcriptional regulator [Gaiellaceae bacterium]